MKIANLMFALAVALPWVARAESILFCCSNPPSARFGLYTMKDDGSDVRPVITTRYVWAPGIAGNGLDVAFVDPTMPSSNLYLVHPEYLFPIDLQ